MSNGNDDQLVNLTCPGLLVLAAIVVRGVVAWLLGVGMQRSVERRL